MDEKPPKPLLAELGGTTAFLLGGAMFGCLVQLLFPLDGPPFIVVCALIGWIAWKSRDKPMSARVFLCLYAAAILWPAVFVAINALSHL